MGFLRSRSLRMKSEKMYVVTFCWSALWGFSFQKISGCRGRDPPEPAEASRERRLSGGHGASLRPLTKLNGLSPISPMPCPWTGLLFLTSLSYTDPDQFVYKTRPPRERPDTFPDVMMNSYLGLWPLRWQMNCLARGHLNIVFWSIQSINLLIFNLISSETHTKSMLDCQVVPALGSAMSPCSELGAHPVFSSSHNLRTATVVVVTLLISKTQQKGWS